MTTTTTHEGREFAVREVLGERLSERWGAMFAGGIVMIALGLLSIVAAGFSTLFTVVFFGALLVVGGLVQLFESVLSSRWQRVIWHLLLSALYVLTGLLLLYAPARGALTLTFVLGTLLLVGGIFRGGLAIAHREVQGWAWALASGIASFVLGILVLSALPVTATWFLGFFVGVELFFAGVSWAAMGMGLKRISRQARDDGPSSRSTPSTVMRSLGE